jgi:lysophospholipase L1-like esterase
MKRIFKSLLFSGALWIIVFPVLAQNPEKFASEVQTLTAGDHSIDKKDVVLFTGSSSVRMWKDINAYFPKHNIVNRGFGGSQTADLIYYFDKLILPYSPKKIFIYEGDNDINSGKTPAEILEANDRLLVLIRDKVSKNVPVYFITPKPSVARWSKKATYESYNQMLLDWAKTRKNVIVVDVWTPMLDDKGVVFQDIFLGDNLHMNKKGYDIWAKVIAPYMN